MKRYTIHRWNGENGAAWAWGFVEDHARKVDAAVACDGWAMAKPGLYTVTDRNTGKIVHPAALTLPATYEGRCPICNVRHEGMDCGAMAALMNELEGQ